MVATDGITIREEGSNIGMNLDLSGLYERMEKGTAYDEVFAETVAIISNATAQAPKIDVDRLMDYEQLKENLSIWSASAVYRLVHPYDTKAS